MSMNDIIAEMTRTAEAAARVPSLERNLNNALVEREKAEVHSQHLEEAIIGYKSQIEALQYRLASVEAERDQYGFRNLETDDLLAKLRSLLGAGDGEKQRIAELEEELTVVKGHRNAHQDEVQKLEVELNVGRKALSEVVAELDTTRRDLRDANAQIDQLTPTIPQVPANPDPIPSGQSEPLPPVASTMESSPPNAAPISDGVTLQEPATIDMSPHNPPATLMPEPLARPYEDKPYYEKPDHLSWEDFVAGGGQAKPYWV